MLAGTSGLVGTVSADGDGKVHADKELTWQQQAKQAGWYYSVLASTSPPMKKSRHLQCASCMKGEVDID